MATIADVYIYINHQAVGIRKESLSFLAKKHSPVSRPPATLETTALISLSSLGLTLSSSDGTRQSIVPKNSRESVQMLSLSRLSPTALPWSELSRRLECR